MSAVVTGVKAKLADLLPDQIGSGKRWSDALVGGYIMAADAAVRDRCETLWYSQAIDLVDDQIEYDLNSRFITIKSVEFSSDGTNYDDFLQPATLGDFDDVSQLWRLDRSARPEFYALLSAPGLPDTTGSADDSAKIVIYRGISSTSGEKIRVNGYGIGLTSSAVPDDIQYKVHVPYVMAMLLAHQDTRSAVASYREFQRGCIEARARFTNKHPGGAGTFAME